MIKQKIRRITYPIRNIFRKTKRVIDFIPILWNGFDFDYRYALELFSHQLKRQAEFMESDKAMTENAHQHASRIRTAIELIDKVYDKEEYGCEYQDILKEEYGEDVFDCVWIPLEKKVEDELPNDWGTDLTQHKWAYEFWDNADEIKKRSDELFKQSQEKQKRAEKLLWEFIHHNIRSWWD